MNKIIVGKNDSGQRLDKFLKKYLPRAPAGFIYKRIRKKDIKLNGRGSRPFTILAEGDVLHIYFDVESIKGDEHKSFVPKAGMDFGIVYEDMNILIADKPMGLLSHSAGDRDEALINQILYYLYRNKRYMPASEKTFTPALCNRLDRNTGGLTIAAVNYKALQDMNRMIREGWVKRDYNVLVKGYVKHAIQATAYLVKDGGTNKVTVKDEPMEGGRQISTCITPLKYSQRGYTFLTVRLCTGRTHQIRAQLSHMGYPVAGDTKYGDRNTNDELKEEFGLKYQFLYASRLIFERTTPYFQYLKGVTVKAELPPELKKIEDYIFG